MSVRETEPWGVIPIEKPKVEGKPEIDFISQGILMYENLDEYRLPSNIVIRLLTRGLEFKNLRLQRESVRGNVLTPVLKREADYCAAFELDFGRILDNGMLREIGLWKPYEYRALIVAKYYTDFAIRNDRAAAIEAREKYLPVRTAASTLKPLEPFQDLLSFHLYEYAAKDREIAPRAPIRLRPEAGHNIRAAVFGALFEHKCVEESGALQTSFWPDVRTCIDQYTEHIITSTDRVTLRTTCVQGSFSINIPLVVGEPGPIAGNLKPVTVDFDNLEIFIPPVGFDVEADGRICVRDIKTEGRLYDLINPKGVGIYHNPRQRAFSPVEHSMT